MSTLDEIRAEPDGKLRAALRAQTVSDAATEAGFAPVARGDLRLLFDAPPRPVLDKAGNTIGINFLVRLFRAATEVRIDPSRNIINPPTQIFDGTFHTEIDPDGKERQVENFRFDPRAAILEALWQSVIGVPNAPGWRTRGTVTTVFATAPGGSGSVKSTHSTTYATARTGGTLAGSANHTVGQDADTAYHCYESFLLFDTSGVPDTDTVSAVVASLDGATSGDQSTTDFVAGIAAGVYNGGPVGSGDWVSGASIPTPELATWNSSGFSANYNAFTETASFAAAINKTGSTALILYSQRHRDGTTPPDLEYVIFTDADAAGTTTDPKLDITHAAAGGGTVVKDIIGAGIIPFAR